jgi:hypothetical protein
LFLFWFNVELKDITDPIVYTLLEDFMNEEESLFPDLFVHLGGDEVNYECFADVLSMLIISLHPFSHYVNKLLECCIYGETKQHLCQPLGCSALSIWRYTSPILAKLLD